MKAQGDPKRQESGTDRPHRKNFRAVRFGLLLAILLPYQICRPDVLPAQGVNKYNDSIIRVIHDLADRRDAGGLLPFLGSPDPNHRGEALFCLGSVQPAGMGDTIFASMQVEQQRVRMMGAWALGQTGQPEVVGLLMHLLETEKDPLVRGMCYEAIGKCGKEEDLNYLAGLECGLQETEGLAIGIFRFGLRGITSVAGNSRILKLIDGQTSTTGMIYASYYLGRYAGMDWLQTVPEAIENAFLTERNPEIRSNLVKALIRARDEEAWPLVKNVLDSNEDYRVKVNILNSMVLIPWNKAVKTVMKFVEGTDPNLSVAAAEAVQRHAVYTDLPVLLESIDKTTNWRSRSLLLGKTLQLVSGKAALVKRVEKIIFESVNTAASPTIRAWYIRALASDAGQYAFVELQLNGATDPVVATAALETLTEMRKSAGFADAAKQAASSGTDLDAEFLRIFKKSVNTGDVTLVALAAGILREPSLGYREKITDTGFLETALLKVNQPAKTEAFVEVVQTLAWLKGLAVPKAGPPVYNHPINWEVVKRLSPKQKALIHTGKGDVMVLLNLAWTPGTVAAFVELAESGFYQNFTIHRVVPNFVMQDGCPRGDGWGGPEFSIRSEFTPAPFAEGTLGMASSGKDTEGSQWYLTHSSTPHLDARYTNFGFVIQGMDVVHRLEVGDKILGIELVKE